MIMTAVLRSLLDQGANRTVRRSVEEIQNKLRPAGTLWTRHFNLFGEDVAFCYRGHSEGDLGVIEQIFGQRDYDMQDSVHERALRAFFDAQRKERTPLIVDAGANIGASTVFFAKKYPGALVYAVEPEAANCRVLRANAEGLDVRVFEAAVNCEDCAMYLMDPGHGDWGFRVVTQGSRQVQALSMSTLLQHAGPHKTFPFICKIDIEGGEAALFSRNTEWVDRFALLVIELHDWMLPFEGTSQAFRRTLAALDFETLQRGENLFCFNRRILAEFRPMPGN